MIRLFQPHVYQGPRNLKHKKGYFEGWYYKFVSHDDKAFAVIPGVSLKKEDSYAFIQTIDGEDGKTSYTTFPLNELKFTMNPFSVTIGKNYFSLDSVSLGDRIPVSGQVQIKDPHFYKATLLRPGIMGWYRYVPAMECYHGVVSSGHRLKGEINYESKKINLNNGRGYIEKDWGTSFPTSYIWMQSNSFSDINNSFMLSVARIPWFGSYFRGFLGFLDLGSRRITFSTYTGSKITIDSMAENMVVLTIKGERILGKKSLKKGEILKVRASRKAAGLLMAPHSGSMDRRISESIDAEISVEYSRNKKILFRGTTKNSGLEIVGDGSELIN
jgi:tocopherol cyclase